MYSVRKMCSNFSLLSDMISHRLTTKISWEMLKVITESYMKESEKLVAEYGGLSLGPLYDDVDSVQGSRSSKKPFRPVANPDSKQVSYAVEHDDASDSWSFKRK